jgi:hypothetical protein
LNKKASPMSMVGFPLLLIPLAIYHIVVLMMHVSPETLLITVPLPSSTAWPVTMSDVLLTLGILLLLCEVIKGARPGAKYLTDHLLSLLVLGGAGAEFALLPQFGTSTYFLLTTLSLADFLSGIALRARRGVAASTAAKARRDSVPAPKPEPQFDAPVASTPAPPPSVPPAASVAESVLLDHPPPKIVHDAEAAPAAPSPEVPSPGLQPSEGSPPSPDAPSR